MILGHGDDIYSHSINIESNFSSNIYNKSDLSGLQKFLCDHISSIHSYPEPDASSVVNRLAALHDVATHNILVTNGATEAIYLIAQAFRGVKTAIVSPTFSEYADASLINGHNVLYVDSLLEITEDTNLVWLCNPNNPTGTVTDKKQLTDYIKSHPSQYIIIDQSYEHFTTKELFSISEAIPYKNVLLLHSMTKHYAIPGLRLGFVTGNEKLLSFVSKFCMPWSVNGLAIEAAKYLLQRNEDIVNLTDYLNETVRFQKALSAIEGITVYPSDTHFFLCRLKDRKASELKEYLIDNYGILIRDAANFQGLDERFFRLATQSELENERLITAIKEWI